MKEDEYSSEEDILKEMASLGAQMEALKKKLAKKNMSSGTPIWDTLRRKYPFGTMPKEKQDCVESTVAQLLETGEHSDEPGLLLGKIQCGKTDTFEDIIGLAFDKGIDIAIVITKGTKALTNQTIKRMEKDFSWFKASDDLDQRSTIKIHDIMRIGRNGFRQAEIESSKTVIVCKKQARNMELLIELFERKSPFLKKKKVLVVDDEADFASRNYRNVKQEARTDENGTPVAQTSEVAMAKISQQIDDFRKIPEFCRYLQVTATPYCLYLQPQGELNLNGNIVKPFKPRFTSLVPSHDRYIGGQQFFVEAANPDSMYSHLYHQLDQKCIDVLGHEDKRYLNSTISSDNISGLTYSLVAYFMATAIRRIQEKNTNNKEYKTSAIFHVEISKKNHDWQRRLIERLIDSIKSVIIAKDHSDQRVYTAVESCYQDFIKSNEKGRKEGLIDVKVPSLKDVLDEIRKILSDSSNNYLVHMVNSDEEVDRLLNEETGELELKCAANIFIGGNILDRGVTIKNMLCFFYGRDPKNFQQDTVLQHARMYGARSKEDMAVMRLHTTPLIYRILVRMNELDEQLRQWFIEGKDKQGSNAVFVGFDKNIKPCASSKIKISNTQLLKPQKRVLPVGFWTLGKTAIKKTMEQIRDLIVTSPGYGKKDADGFFEMKKDRVIEILKLIESTYVYEDKFLNSDRKNDIKEMLCALEYCADKSNGKIWALHREDRNMNRIRENGGFIDAPEDGRTDLKPAHAKATDAPVIMFIQQNGAICRNENKENIGWNGAPFYWPVLLTQADITTVMFALDQKAKGQVATIDNSEFLQGYDPKDILSLTLKGGFERFGEVGMEYEYDECPVETRVLKQTTAGKYIQKDESGNWKLNPKVAFDKKHDHGLYSINKGRFPFVVRPYKYMCLRNGRDARADIILLELFEPDKWDIYPIQNFNDDGALIDRDTRAVLTHAKDTIVSKNMKKREVTDKTIAQWEIDYPIKKVLKLKMCSAIDWDAVFGNTED